ncbi:MAG: hypothetical protein M0000_00285 [Actinomycetota bacterium]|nr:hypothetical protein [Actinomycetota bacterium]
MPKGLSRMVALALPSLALAACSNGASASSVSSPTSTTSTARVASTPSRPSSPPALPAGNAVPAGFEPLSFTAVSTTQWWLLGFAPCGPKECEALVSTTDKGATFTSVAVPGGAFGPASTQSPALSQVRFADPEDGWLWGRGGFYATHDGGASWTAISIPGVVSALHASAGAVYAVITPPTPACASIGTCVVPTTPGANLWRADASGNDWRRLPAAGIVSPFFAVRGASIWIMDATFTPDGWALANSRLLHSTDGGATFVTEPQAVPGTFCSYSPVSDAVVWADCAGGHFDFAYLSTDAGVQFVQVGPKTGTTPYMAPAGSVLDGASPQIAVESYGLPGGPDGGHPLIRTIDGGANWQAVEPALDSSGAWFMIGFTTPEVGYAFWTTRTSSWAGFRNQLWRTTDAGATWGPVPIQS